MYSTLCNLFNMYNASKTQGPASPHWGETGKAQKCSGCGHSPRPGLGAVIQCFEGMEILKLIRL